MNLTDFVAAVHRAKTPEAATTLVERAAAARGFDRYAYCALTRQNDYVARQCPPPAVVLNFPAAWTDHYFERDYARQDPVLACAPALEGPFLWDWLHSAYRLNRTQRRIMREAREAKLRDGIGVTVRGASGDVSLMTFAASEGHPSPEAEMHELGVIATQFSEAYRSIGRRSGAGPAIKLTPRERECLRWLSLSKQTSDIATLMGVSENTVKHHVKELQKKLDAGSRIGVVTTAIREGLIDPHIRTSPPPRR